MPTTLLTIGPVHNLVQNLTYALPSKACAAQVMPAASAIEVSNDGTTWQALTITDGQFFTTGAFIRTTAVATSLCLRLGSF